MRGTPLHWVKPALGGNTGWRLRRDLAEQGGSREGELEARKSCGTWGEGKKGTWGFTWGIKTTEAGDRDGDRPLKAREREERGTQRTAEKGRTGYQNTLFQGISLKKKKGGEGKKKKQTTEKGPSSLDRHRTTASGLLLNQLQQSAA